MDEGAPHVAPEVIVAVPVLVEESQPAPDDRVHHRHARPGHMVLIHHLHPHALPERVLHALRHLATTSRGGEINPTPRLPSPEPSENSFSPHTALRCPKLPGRHLWEGTHGSEFIGGAGGCQPHTRQLSHFYRVQRLSNVMMIYLPASVLEFLYRLTQRRRHAERATGCLLTDFQRPALCW